MLMSKSLKTKVLAVWSAVLAAMPYISEWCFYHSFPEPSVPTPGQAAAFPIAFVLFFLIAWDRLRIEHIEPKLLTPFKNALVIVGLLATIALAILEVVLFVNRGNPYRNDFEIAVYDFGIVAEPLDTILAILGWSLLICSDSCAVGLHEATNSTSNIDGKTGLCVSYAVGAIWPCVCALILEVAPGSVLYAALASVVSAFVAATLFVRILNDSQRLREGNRLDLLVCFLSGQVSFALVRGIRNELQSHMIEQITAAELYLCFLILISSKLLAFFKSKAVGKKASENAGSSVLNTPKEIEDENVVSAANQIPDLDILLSSKALKPLSSKELDVLILSIQGKSASDIADELGTSRSTIATYRRRGYDKLGIKDLDALHELVSFIVNTDGDERDCAQTGANNEYEIDIESLATGEVTQAVDATPASDRPWPSAIGSQILIACLIVLLFRWKYMSSLEEIARHITMLLLPLLLFMTSVVSVPPCKRTERISIRTTNFLSEASSLLCILFLALSWRCAWEASEWWRARALLVLFLAIVGAGLEDEGLEKGPKRSSKGILATFELVSAVLRYGSNQLFCHKNSLALVASSLTISLFFPESMNPEHYGIWVHVAEFAFPVALILEAFVLVQNAMVHVVKPEEPAAIEPSVL